MELEASLVDVAEDNRKFKDIAVAKVRAVKRTWMEAFENRSHVIEREIKEKVKNDQRVNNLKQAIGSIDSKIEDITNDTRGVVTFARSVEKHVREINKLLRCIPTSYSEHFVCKWADWQISYHEDRAWEAVDLLLNPVCDEQLLDKIISCCMESMPSFIKSRYQRDPAYRPYINPDDRKFKQFRLVMTDDDSSSDC